LLGVLRLAEADAALGRLDDARLENIQLENIHKTVSEIIEDLAAREAPNVPVPREAASGKGKIINIDTCKLGSSVFCILGLSGLDDCAALAADVLKRQGIVARTAGASAIEADDAEICVCFLEDVTEARTDFTRRKLSRQTPSAKVVVCLLGESNENRDSDDPPNDVAPRSLKGVLAAVEKKCRIFESSGTIGVD
jgi:hypothetical protein